MALQDEHQMTAAESKFEAWDEVRIGEQVWFVGGVHWQVAVVGLAVEFEPKNSVVPWKDRQTEDEPNPQTAWHASKHAKFPKRLLMETVPLLQFCGNWPGNIYKKSSFYGMKQKFLKYFKNLHPASTCIHMNDPVEMTTARMRIFADSMIYKIVYDFSETLKSWMKSLKSFIN